MKTKDLINCFGFALKYDITKAEMKALVVFMGKPISTIAAAKILEANPNTLHNSIRTLKLKKLLTFTSRDSKGNNLYKFNEEAN